MHPLVDLSGGYVSTIAVLAGLWRARRDGVGCDCDISLYETALHELMYVGTWAATKGYTPPRRRNSAHPSLVPFQNFATADGWIVVACPKPKFWERFCTAIGAPKLVEDERFVDFAARDRNRDELEHPSLGTVREVASPLRLSGEQRTLVRGPFRGEHTERVLVELCGYEPEHVRELAAAGVFGEVG